MKNVLTLISNDEQYKINVYYTNTDNDTFGKYDAMLWHYDSYIGGYQNFSSDDMLSIIKRKLGYACTVYNIRFNVSFADGTDGLASSFMLDAANAKYL